MPSPLDELEKVLTEKVIQNLKVNTLEEYEKTSLKYSLAKDSLTAKASAFIKSLSEEDRKKEGERFNRLKMQLNEELATLKKTILSRDDENAKWIDLTLPLKKEKIGHLSPDTKVIRKMNSFFIYHGYSIAEGPDIETDDYNFERTNLPKDHPARDLQDTIYIEKPEILLRTHTSSVETRILSNFKPPFRFVVPGVSFRNEILNPSNHAIFYQYQGVVVDQGISMANLKATIEEFAKFMYGENVKTRFRTKYYPEVEPGAGLDILCDFCKGKGCRICKSRGWLEILGCGMIHRNLLEKCGIDYREWTGFAFGMGLSRIIMTKFGIEDIRHLHGGNLMYEDSL